MTPHPQRCDWIEEVRLRCYLYTEFYGGERAIRFDELEEAIQQIKEERKECCASHSKSEQCPHWMIVRAAGIDGDYDVCFCNAKPSEQDDRDKVLDELLEIIDNYFDMGYSADDDLLVILHGWIRELRKGEPR